MLPFDACIGGACAHSDDWAAYVRRADLAPCLLLLNAFVGYQLSTIDAGAHRSFARMLVLANMLFVHNASQDELLLEICPANSHRESGGVFWVL